MSEVYSKTPPTEPGWYWVRSQQEDGTGDDVVWNEEVVQCVLSQSNGRVWLMPPECYSGREWTESLMLEDGFEFGPRVPSAVETEAIQSDQARLAWLFRTVLQAWPREKIDAQMARDAELLQACNEEYDTDEDFMDPECP